MAKTILMIGAFDSKGEEYSLLRKLIETQGCQVLAMNFGGLASTDLFPVDIEHAEVAKAGGSDISQLKTDKDRGTVMKIMSQGVAVLAKKLYNDKKFDGVIGMGGTGGTSVISSAMKALPIGVPKVLVSTMASGDTAPVVGIKDITMIPSIVDVAGVNPISEKIFKQAAGAICGMVNMDYTPSIEQKPVITVTMFGNTTQCVDDCRKALVGQGYEVLVFHCTGTGGKTMEGLVDEGYVSAVLDITTTEWADELCGGVFRAGESRLEAAGKAGIPHLIVPGCVDMVNFGAKNTIPEKYNDRNFFEWNPLVTLMRTNIEENVKMGEIFAQKANASTGKVGFLIPLKGVSILDSEGQQFWWPEADRAMFDSIKKHVNPDIPVVEVDANINDEAFSQKAVEMLLDLMQ